MMHSIWKIWSLAEMFLGSIRKHMHAQEDNSGVE